MRAAQSGAARDVVKGYRLGQVVVYEGYRVLDIALMREHAVKLRLSVGGRGVLDKLSRPDDKPQRQKAYLETVPVSILVRAAERYYLPDDVVGISDLPREGRSSMLCSADEKAQL